MLQNQVYAQRIEFTGYGKTVYEYKDSLRGFPASISDFFPDIPVHDSIYYKTAVMDQGDNCVTENRRDDLRLQRCLGIKNCGDKICLGSYKKRTTIYITDGCYYCKGVPHKLDNLYMIVDEKLNLRERAQATH